MLTCQWLSPCDFHLGMLRAVETGHHRPWPVEVLEQMLVCDHKLVGLAKDARQEPLGYFVARVDTDGGENPEELLATATLYRFMVAMRHRRRGIGPHLLAYFHESILQRLLRAFPAVRTYRITYRAVVPESLQPLHRFFGRATYHCKLHIEHFDPEDGYEFTLDRTMHAPFSPTH